MEKEQEEAHEGRGLDPERAFAFLAQSRSRFVQAAADWLAHWDDPVDVLFALSGKTGQALGPWETFRFCAVLGLTPHQAVQDLAQDVLSEPVSTRQTSPPIAQAFAVAHAAQVFSDQQRVTAGAIADALHRNKNSKGVPAGLHAAALLAIAKVAGDDVEPVKKQVEREMKGADAKALAGPFLEAAILTDASALISSALDLLAQSQQEDGGLTALETHEILRGYVTLRALGLQLRLLAQREG